MKIKELRVLPELDLKKAVNNLRQEVMTLRFDHAVGKVINTASAAKKRKELARVLTLLNEMEIKGK